MLSEHTKMILMEFAVLWWSVNCAKVKKNDAFPPDVKKDLLTPLRQYGETCGYESCPLTKPGHLNIHMVPNTHMELGYRNNIEQHYTGEDDMFMRRRSNAELILDAVLSELWANEKRKFTLSDTAYLFYWWARRDATVRRMVYELIRQGRLFLVGGGFSMSDAASVSYQAVIDHYTYSLRKINATFMECGRPLVAWQAEVYGHSREFTSLLAQMGFDGLFINPISYDDEAGRMRRQALEFLWRGSDELGQDTDIFTHKLFDGYWSPAGFCFGWRCSDPLLITSDSLFKNVQERVDLFIKLMRFYQAPNYATKHIMVMMGHSFAFYDAATWFGNIETLMAGVNKDGVEKRLNISIFYSSPPCYLQSVNEENPLLETKQDDFFPYVLNADTYYVGMYTSRPTLKYIVREGYVYLQMAKQLQVTANLGNNDSFFEYFMWIMTIIQDHTIVTGSVTDTVKSFYVGKLYASVGKATQVMSKAIWKHRNVTKYVPYARCMFNISSCNQTRYIQHSLHIYNPLGWPVSVPVRLPCHIKYSKFNVYDHKGDRVESVTMKTAKPILSIKGRTNTDHEVVFIAEDVPPIGFRSYFVQADYYDGPQRRKRSVIKNVKLPNSKRYYIRQINPLLMEEIRKQEADITPDYEMYDEPPFPFNASAKNVGATYKSDTDYEYQVLKYTPADTYMNTSGIGVINHFAGAEIADVTTGAQTNASPHTTDIATDEAATEEATTIRVTDLTTQRITTEEVAIEPVTDEVTTVAVSTEKLTTLRTADDTLDTFSTTVEVTTEKLTTPRTADDTLDTFSTTVEVTTEKLTTPRTADDTLDKFSTARSQYVPETTSEPAATEPSHRRYFEVKNDSNDSFIGNKYVRLDLNGRNRTARIRLCNGVEISLNVQLYYIVSDEPAQLRRPAMTNPGIYTFRAMDPENIFMDTDYHVEVIKNDIVEEFHIKFNDWAFLIIRLYRDSSVIELNWLVGPIPVSDGLGKEVFIKYSTDLENDGVFYTDSNGRQTIKRLRNKRATYNPVEIDQLAGNLYPVTSKIYIEDLKKNIRFAVFNDRCQAGGSLKDGNIDLMVHRRILTADTPDYTMILNETEYGEGIKVIGTHYLYVTKADYKKNRIFEKKLAKEIELSPRVLVSFRDYYRPEGMREEFYKGKNEFSALKKKLPIGVHLLTLEKWSENILIRLENYLEKPDVLKSGVKTVFLKELFKDIEILRINETTLAGNMLKTDAAPKQWMKKERFFKYFNDEYGGVGNNTFEGDYVPNEEDSLELGIKLKPQQIRTFIAEYKYRTGIKI